MSIITEHLKLQVILDKSFAKTGNLDGVYAKLAADGKTALPITSATDKPDGILSNPESREDLGPDAVATATLVLMGAPYKLRINTGDTPAGIGVNTKLALKADGTVKAATGEAGEIIVGYALEAVTSASSNQRVAGVLAPKQ